MRATRIDIGSELSPPVRLPDGRIRVDARLTRTGVFVYHDAEGREFREYRPPSEVFDAESLSTLELAPVTDDHPAGMVTPDNARSLAIGAVGNARHDDRFVAAHMSIFDRNTIQKMAQGKREISCGYTAEIVIEPGVTPDGEHYDAVQKKIVYNHVAIVDQGRAGPEVAARFDGAAVTRFPGVNTVDETQRELLNQIKRCAELESEVKAANERADAAEAKLADIDTLKADRDSEKVRADKAESALQDRVDAAFASGKARAQLERTCEAILNDEYKADASDRDLRCAVVKRLDGDDIDSNETDDYVRARFDAAIKRYDKAGKDMGAIRTSLKDDNDTSGSRADDAHAAMIKRNRDAWKTSA